MLLLSELVCLIGEREHDSKVCIDLFTLPLHSSLSVYYVSVLWQGLGMLVGTDMTFLTIKQW